MTEREDLINSLKREIKDCDDLLKVTKDLNDAVPNIQERKREAEAKLLLVEKTPSDFIAEVGPKYFPSQLEDEGHLSVMVKDLKKSTDPLFKFINVTSGTTSTSYTVISVLNEDYSWEKPPDWINVVEAYTRLADDKAKKTDLPPKLDKINRDLGKQFTVALASIEKAKTEISGVDIAAIHMRDVLHQIWGGLTLLARKKNSKRNRNLEFKKTDDRIRIAEILGEDDSKKKKLVLLLDNMYALHLDLSDTDLTKNPLSNNLIRMNELFEKWILQIDDLVNILRI